MALTFLQVLGVARVAIPLLPPTTELSASFRETGDPLPIVGAPVVITTFSVETLMQVMLAVSDPIAETLEGAEGMTPVQILVPVPEAAAATLTTGVLENTGQANVVEQLAAGDWTSATLEAENSVEGWLPVREIAAGVADAASAAGAPEKEGESATTPPASQATATAE